MGGDANVGTDPNEGNAVGGLVGRFVGSFVGAEEGATGVGAPLQVKPRDAHVDSGVLGKQALGSDSA